MWLVFLVLTAVANGERQNVIETHLDGAMVGFNPFCMNGFSQPNPGTKSMILQPLRAPLSSLNDDFKPSRFINEAEELKCIPELTVQTVTNYVDYKDLAASSVFQLASDATHGLANIRYDNDAICLAKNNRPGEDVFQFFKQTGGEIVFASAECVTHTITVTPFEPLAFTPAFETALVSLYTAALEPSLKTSDKTFSDFIWSYGTHFSKRTQLGAKVFMGKTFANRSATVDEEAARRRCVLEAARKVLTAGERVGEEREDTYRHFVRESSKSCGGPERAVMVAVAGPLPEASLQNWASVAEELPDPIFYLLEPISTLFTREWQSSHGGIAMIDKSVLNQYFVEKLSQYTNRTLTGGFQQPALSGCGLNSRCQAGTVCLNEANSESGYRCVSKSAAGVTPSTTTSTASPMMTSTTSTAPSLSVVSGGVVIIGGAGVRVFSEAIDAPQPAAFPGLVYGNAAVTTGSTVYSCGGQGKYEKACYFLGSQDTEWRSIALPWPLVAPSAVTVQNDVIWLLQDSTLYMFNTKKDRSQFREYRLSFPFSVHFCAVTNQTHTFAIGVGLDFDEVWVNKNPSKPTKWDKVSILPQGRQGHACLWFGSEIFVTGGRDGEYNGIDAVEVINVQDNTIRTMSPLVYSREDHKMAVLHGKPAVLGGYSSRVPTDTIEVYDTALKEWELLDYTMKEKRVKFGLAQYRS